MHDVGPGARALYSTAQVYAEQCCARQNTNENHEAGCEYGHVSTIDSAVYVTLQVAASVTSAKVIYDIGTITGFYGFHSVFWIPLCGESANAVTGTS